MRVPLASTGLREKDIEAAVAVLRSGNLTMGQKVKEFESRMAEYLRVKHFVMVNSGSSANLAMIEALMRPAKKEPLLRAGDGVLVPAIAWPTTVWPIVQLGLTPIFVDIDPTNLAMDLLEAQKIVDADPNIRALFPIHVLGYGLSGDLLANFAQSNNLILINDVCESLGSWPLNSHAGTAGLAGSFSFYFSHHLTTMEGGGICTNDDSFADDMKSIRSHGWSRDRSDAHDWNHNTSKNDARFLFISTGYNIRPMEIQAAIGLAQLDDLDDFVIKRRTNAQRIAATIEGSDIALVGSEVLSSVESQVRHSWMMLPLRIMGKKAQRRKGEIITKLAEAGIETRPVLTGNFLAQPAIKKIVNLKSDTGDFLTASEIADSSFLIGNHHDFTEEQVALICSTLAACR